MTRGRTLRLSDVTGPVPGLRGAQPRPGRFSPSAERSRADRERRHRERAIAAWLRDLSR